MYIKQVVIFVLATLAPLIDARARVLRRQNGVIYQTSNVSLSLVNIINVINELKGRGLNELCSQTNREASKCITLVTQDSAAIFICGGIDEESAGRKCSKVVDLANQIQQICKNDGLDKAEGTYTINASQRVKVINSGDTWMSHV